MAIDPITVAKLWVTIKPFKRWKAHRQAKREGREPEATEVSMNSTVFVQIVLGVVRHAMTALGPLGVTLSEDAMVQVATVIVTLLGLAWSTVRKVKAAKPA